MFLKGAFKDSSFIAQLFMLFVVLTAGAIGASLFTYILIFFRFGLSIESAMEVLLNISNYPDLMRGMQFFQVIGLFIFPAIICGWLFSDSHKSYLKIDLPIKIDIALLTLLSAFVAIPFIYWTAAINQQMVFPEFLKGVEEWMQNMEKVNEEVLKKLLYADTYWIFLFNVLIICVLTGIGEEFLFRGVLQNLLGKILKNPHLVIWIAAFIFSTVHFQFYGFLPRLLLGAYFGYLLLYTKNMWIPVLGHFANNFFSITTAYIYQDAPEEMLNEVDTIGTGETWWLTVVSFALFVFLFWQIKKRADLK